MNLEPFLQKKILVVDDMASIRDALIAILRRLGFVDIHQAVDGKMGWLKVQENALYEPFDIIFSDVMMPNCNGIEFLQLVRSHAAHQKTPILMVTAENEKDTIFGAIEAGASSYILKPFNVKIIEQKLFEILSKQATQK